MRKRSEHLRAAAGGERGGVCANKAAHWHRRAALARTGPAGRRESLIVEHGYVRGVINATMFHLQARLNLTFVKYPTGA